MIALIVKSSNRDPSFASNAIRRDFTATIFNTRITWHFVPQAGIYLAIDNIGNARAAVSGRAPTSK